MNILTAKVFGIEHIMYLLVTTILGAAFIFLVKRFCKEEKQLQFVVRITGAVLLCLIIANRICISIREDCNWIYLVPDSFCGVASFTMAIALLIGKKDGILFHFVCYIGLVGGLAATIYPDFIGQADSFFYHATITGLLHHSVLVISILMVTITKYFTPTLKKWYALPLGMCVTMSLGVFDMTVLGMPNAMLIGGPIISGTVLTWWFMGILIMAAALLAMFIFDCANKRIVLIKKE